VTTEAWPWVALAALGFFHGMNPAMGWLFAVALGMHRQSRRLHRSPRHHFFQIVEHF